MKNKNLLIVAFSIFFYTNFSFGQINLGTASNFVLFTAAGAFDNIGSSNIIGDIGTNVGTVTGFPPGNLTGQIQEANSITAQAAIDVENAYNDLSGVTCDSVIGSTLGPNQVLTPNVYCITSAAVLNGDLTLDAGGNPNALFIIKINGLIDVTAFSNVILTNAASVNNVYWQIGGAVNVYDSAVFNGIILADGALSFYQGSVLNGNGLSRAGAISTISMTATLSNDFAMPIELIEFEGINKYTYNLFSWSTASEMNNSYFTLERTTDGVNFNEVVLINGVGTSSSTNNYTYSDYSFEKRQNYYRLSQTDFDGKSEVLGLISINNTQTSSEIVKVLNMMGQEVDQDYSGLRVIYFNNGKILKIMGKYTHIQ